MATIQILEEGFRGLNITVKEDVLRRCEDLCTRYKIDPEDFVDEWLAYTASNLYGAPPSLEALDKMERKELQKQNTNGSMKTPQTPRHKAVAQETPLESSFQEEFSGNESISYIEPVKEVASQPFLQRADSRSVQRSFGDCQPNTFKECGKSVLNVKILGEELIQEKYMYEKFIPKGDAINFVTRWIASGISTHYGLELSEQELTSCVGKMVICGRVYSEFPEKLHVHSLMLEGVWELYEGETVKLRVDDIDKYSFFSGQVVVLEGYKSRTQFSVNKVYYGTPLPLPEKPFISEEPLQIVVAAGPYTMPENLLYEPLEELLKYVEEYKPNLLILMGPFLDENHKILEKTNECFDIFFESVVDGIMERVKGIGTQVILVPSVKDVHHHPIYPTPQFELKKRSENLFCAPNPFVLDINGLMIGGSTTDILYHLNKAEISKNLFRAGFDRMSHLVSHLIHQKSFYPLYPPDPDVSLDYELFEKYAMLEELPHLMFLPSTLASFVKNVGGCIVVNPERLSKGQHGGNFARVEVRPGNGSVSDRVSCQILRV